MRVVIDRADRLGEAVAAGNIGDADRQSGDEACLRHPAPRLDVVRVGKGSREIQRDQSGAFERHGVRRRGREPAVQGVDRVAECVHAGRGCQRRRHRHHLKSVDRIGSVFRQG